MSGADGAWSSIHGDFLRFQSHAPVLYDFLMSYGLTWASLSAQWLPVEPIRSTAATITHQMLIGTYTPPGCQSRAWRRLRHCRRSSQQHARETVPNFIQLAHVTIPDKENMDLTREFFQNPLAAPLRTAPDRAASAAGASSSRRAVSAASASSAAASSAAAAAAAAAAPAASTSPSPPPAEEYSASLPFYSRGSLKLVHKVRASQELHRIRPFAPSFRRDIGASSSWCAARDDDGARNGGPGQHSKALAAAKGPESEVKIYDVGRGAHQAQLAAAAAAAGANGHVHPSDEGGGSHSHSGGGGGRKKSLASIHPYSGAKERDSALLTLTGHVTGGWALDWNGVAGAAESGLLVSADDQGSICLWSLEDAQTGLFGTTTNGANAQSNGTMHPPPSAAPTAATGAPAKRLQKGAGASAAPSSRGGGGGGGGSSSSSHYQVPSLGARCSWSGVHDGAINDIAWLKVGCAHTFLSVGDDRSMKRWDYRQAPQSSSSAAPTSVCTTLIHDCNVTSVSTSPFDEQQVLTAGEDGLVRLWDMRQMKDHTPLHTFVGHGSKVLQVSWAPFAHRGRGSIFASSSLDRRIFLWDASQVGSALPDWDLAESGPPELLFVHAGHTDSVEDFSWHPTQPWMVASVGAENVLQVWEMFDALHPEKEEETVHSAEEEEAMQQFVQLLQPSGAARSAPLDLDALMSLGSSLPSHSVCAEMRASLSTPRMDASIEFVADYAAQVQRRLDAEGIADDMDCQQQQQQQQHGSDSEAHEDADANGEMKLGPTQMSKESRSSSSNSTGSSSSSSRSSSRSPSPRPPSSSSARRAQAVVHASIKLTPAAEAAHRKRKREEDAAVPVKGNGSNGDSHRSAAVAPAAAVAARAAPSSSSSSSASSSSDFSSLPLVWQARLREFKSKHDSVDNLRTKTARARFKVAAAKLADFVPDEAGLHKRPRAPITDSSDSDSSDSSDSSADQPLLPPASTSHSGAPVASRSQSAGHRRAASPRKRASDPAAVPAPAVVPAPAPTPVSSRRSLPPDPLPRTLVPRKYSFARLDDETVVLSYRVPRALAELSTERTADKKARKNQAMAAAAAVTTKHSQASAATQHAEAAVTPVKIEPPADAAAAVAASPPTSLATPPQPAINGADIDGSQ